MVRKLIIAAVVLALLAGAGTIAWEFLEWPPPHLILKHGPRAQEQPTGRRIRIASGLTAIELPAGYYSIRIPAFRQRRTQPQAAIDRARKELQLPASRTAITSQVHWFELGDSFWFCEIAQPDRLVHEFSEACAAEGLSSDPNSAWLTNFCRWLTTTKAGRYEVMSQAQLHAANALGLTPSQFRGPDEDRPLVILEKVRVRLCGTKPGTFPGTLVTPRAYLTQLGSLLRWTPGH